MRNTRPRLLRIVRVRQRRAVAWVDRHAGEGLAWVPSWGTSLVVHGLIILMLALYLYAYGGRDRSRDIEAVFSTQLTEDLNSLGDANRAGDPFTTVKTEELPSLAVEPEGTKTNQPEIPNLATFGPELAGPVNTPLAMSLDAGPSTRRVKGGGTGTNLGTIVNRVQAEDMTAPFSGRDEMIRARIVRREGGTVRSEKAVQNGLDWITRHQRGDGSWGLEFRAQCQGQGCAAHASGRLSETDSAATGLALLPLLGAGHIHTKKTRYQSQVRQGLAWLLGHQAPTGELFTGGTGQSRMYSHAIATMALCEAFGLSQDPGLRGPAQRAINFIAESQNGATGGWRYQPGQPGDTSVFGWQMFALRSARLSGLRVSKNVFRGCKTYLDLAATDSKRTVYAYMPGMGESPVMTAEALLSRQYLGWSRDYPPLVKGAGHVAKHLEATQERNIYYWYYATQLLHNMQNDDWKRWNLRVREGLVTMQVAGDGCDRGSWDPSSPQPDRWASSGGRLFLTSLSTLTLEVYYRYLPLYQLSDRVKIDEPEKEGAAP